MSLLLLLVVYIELMFVRLEVKINSRVVAHSNAWAPLVAHSSWIVAHYLPQSHAPLCNKLVPVKCNCASLTTTRVQIGQGGVNLQLKKSSRSTAQEWTNVYGSNFARV